MEIQQLRYFVLSAQRGSFKAAAEELFVSRAALSKAVAKLEAEVGGPLFDRSRSGVCLTPAGQRFLEKAAPVVGGYDELEKTIGGEHGVVRVSLGIPLTWTDAFMPAVERFSAEHPDVRVSVSSWTDPECVRKLRDGELDVLVSHLPVADSADEGKVLLRTPLYIAMNEACPLAGREVLTEADLADQRIVYYTCGCNSLAWAPRIGGRSEDLDNDILHVYSLVHSGEAVFPTPLPTVPAYVEHVVCRRFSGAFDEVVMSGYIAAAAKGSARLCAACRQLRDALVLDTEAQPLA